MNVKCNFYEVIFNAPAYWWYANKGGEKGRRPPISVISKWIERRNITPYALKNGKMPAPEQLPFMIANAIARDGTKFHGPTGIHFLEKSIDEQKSYWDDKISEAISNDIIAELDSFFNNPIWSVKS